jgi:alkylation response protein AidB-like acyl-CoA dehydrogenase
LLAEGKGLRVALTTLDTGRLTLPAACTGLSKRCLKIARAWAGERVQWGAPIGKHAAIADKLARMAGDVYAMEAMTLLAASRVDRDKHADVRLEAAMCKLWATETSWRIVNDTMQIRGGRGYETAASLKARGEPGIALERMLRDCRINTIFEGSSEIMRLFIAREALDAHLQVGGAAMNSNLPWSQRLGAGLRAARFYAFWYPKQWLPREWFSVWGATSGVFEKHLRYAEKMSRRLARAIFHAMLRHGPKLEREQLLLGRLVDIATELYAMTSVCLRAESDLRSDTWVSHREFYRLIDYYCRSAKLRIKASFRGLHHNADRAGYKVSQDVMGERHLQLERGIV